jgi:hypothetical protein
MDIQKGHFATDGQGNVRILVDGQWVAPEQKAVNDAGDEAYLVNGQWMTRPIGSAKAVADQAFGDQPDISRGPDEMPDNASVMAAAKTGKDPLPAGGGMTPGLATTRSPTAEKGPYRDFVTAEGRYAPLKDADGKVIEEIDGAPGKGTGWDIKMAALFIAETDPARRAKIIEFNLPGSKAEVRGEDVIITMPNGEQRVLNKRGLSMRDVVDTISAIGKMIIIAKTGGSAAGLLGGAARAGAATGAMELAGGTASALGGSEKPLVETVKDAAMGAAFAAGGTLLVGGTFKAAKALRKKGRLFKGDQLSPAGRALLKKSGVDPDDLTPETIRELKPIIGKARNAKEAVRLAEARGLKVNLTRGQVTRDPAALGREDVLAKGGVESLGDDASRLAAMRQGQPKSLAAAGDDVAGRVTGTPLSPDRGASMKAAQEKLGQLYAAEKKAVRAAYDAAKNGNVKVATASLKDYANQLRAIRDEFTDPQVKSAVNTILKKIQAKGVTSISLTELENARKVFTNLRGNPSQFAAAARLRGVHDDVMNGLGDDAFKRGGPQAVKAYRKAVSMRKEMAKRFDDDKAIMEGVGKSRVGDDFETAAPEEFAQKIFGKSGLSPVKGADKTIKRLKTVLGKDSAEFQGVKNEVISRVFQGTPESWPNRLNRFVKGNPTLARELFTKAEMAQLRTLARVSDTAMNAPVGVYNKSGSAINLLRDNPAIKRMPIVGNLVKYPENVGNDMFARRAMVPLIPANSNNAVAGLGGAAIGGDERRRQAIVRMLQGQ